MDLPLFPLHTVLCPGVALPLHVFEDRYKAMVERCLADRSPFGVILIREGREVGTGDLAVAGVGTVAEIREATRYPDGRYDLVTMGTQRFRLEGVDPEAEPYLVGRITPLDEILGEADRAMRLGQRVMDLFIRYLEALQLSERLADDATPTASSAEVAEPERAGTDATDETDEIDDRIDDESITAPELTFGERAAPLDDAARRLAIPKDPTVLSYLLSAIVQVDPVRRQGLLEVATTELRLVELGQLLEREIALLDRGLTAYAPDPRISSLRRN